MGISTWGWGSACGGLITTGGWGECPCADFIPVLLAAYLESNAYCWVATRTYVEVQTRDRGDILLRVKPDQIPQRLKGAVRQRVADDILIRSAGWPSQSGEICED
jgi:hypothetical protein